MLEVASPSYEKISDHVQILNQMDIVIRENEDLKNKLSTAMCNNSNKESANVSNMLRLLLDCAETNADKNPNG